MPDPNKPSKLSIKDIVRPRDVSGEGIYGGQQYRGLNQDEFDFSLKINADNEKLRAQDQGFMESLGLRLGNFVPNVLTGMGEMLGYAGALVTESGKERDYSNEFTKLMQSMKNPLGEVYRENPDQVFDLTDSAWWLNNLGDLAESATQFAIPASGIGKAFGALAKAASIGKKSGIALNALARTGTAASLAFTEGAMSGYRIYEQTYNTQFQKAVDAGVTPTDAHEFAKQRASDAAATTVQMNTVMNTALNMTALAPFFKRSEDEVIDFMRKYAGKENTLEGLTELASRKGLFKNRHGITSYRSESFQEGLEEVNTQYAEQEGERVGQGKKRSLFAALTDFDSALKDVSNQEGALNFLLGSIGGVAQTAILDNIPVHKVAADPTKPTEYTRVSTRARNIDGTRKYFNSVAEAITNDFTNYKEQMQELAKAKQAGDNLRAETIRNEMFDTLALSAVQLGAGEQWINTFKEIAETSNAVDKGDLLADLETINNTDLDPTAKEDAKQKVIQAYESRQSDAVSKGLARSEMDNSYKERAQQAIEDIKYYQKLHDDTYAKFATEEEQAAGVADYMFYTGANLYRQQRMLERGYKDLEAMQNDAALQFKGTPKSEEVFDRHVAEFADAITLNSKIIERVRGHINEFNNGDEATKQRIAASYRLSGYIGNEFTGKLNAMMNRQVEDATKSITAAEKKVEESTGFAQWKESNPKGTLQQYIEQVKQRYGASDAVKSMESQLATLSAVTEANRIRYNDLMANKDNTKKLIRKIRSEETAAVKDATNKATNREVQEQLEATAVRAHEQMNWNARKDRMNRLRNDIGLTEGELAEVEKQLANINDKIRNLSATRSTAWKIPWTLKLVSLELKKDSLEKDRNKKETRLAELNKELQLLSTDETAPIPRPVEAQTPTPTPVAEKPVEEPAPVTPKSPVVQTGSKYEALLQRMPAEVHPAFTRYEEQRKAGVTITYDEFRMFPEINRAIIDGLVWERTLKQALSALDEYIDTLPKQPEVGTISEQGTAIEKLEKERVKELHDLLPKQSDGAKDDIDFVGAFKLDIPVFYQQLFEMVKNGKDSIAGVKEKYAELLTKLYKQGKINSVEDVWLALNPTAKTINEKYDAELKKFGEAPMVEDLDDIFGKVEKVWDNALSREQAPITQDMVPTTNIAVDGGPIHANKKTTNALKVNVNTLMTEDYVNDNGDYAIAGTELNKQVNPDILNPEKLLDGTPVILALDRDFEGLVRQPGYMNRTRKMSYADYIDANGNIIDMDNVPIKIMDIDGKTIGYLPIMDWVLDRYPGTIESDDEAYRNIVKTIYSAEGNAFDNLAHQMKRLRHLRQEVIRNGGQLKTTIATKGPGTVISNKVKEADGKFRTRPDVALSYAHPEESMLPDPALNLAIVKNGKAFAKKGESRMVNNEDQIASWDNSTGVLLPMADGSFTFSPLIMDMIEEERDLGTIERAIELYLQGSPEEIAQVRQQFDIDLSTSDGLRNFINSQYTYLDSFDATHTAQNTEKEERFLFNITEPSDGKGKGKVMIGWAFSGRKPLFAQLKNGKLDPTFAAQLREGLVTRPRNVNFTTSSRQGINEFNAFNELVYSPSRGWKAIPHDNYNKFVLTHALTYVYGKNKQDGRYIYAANPAITLAEQTQPVITQNTPITPVLVPHSPEVAAKELDSTTAEDLAASLGIEFEAAPRNIAYDAKGKNMQLITLDMLEELYNFTPPSQRNDKTPAQIYEELSEQGFPYLAKGHNPFTKCG
jgi:hypothetical protein